MSINALTTPFGVDHESTGPHEVDTVDRVVSLVPGVAGNVAAASLWTPSHDVQPVGQDHGPEGTRSASSETVLETNRMLECSGQRTVLSGLVGGSTGGFRVALERFDDPFLGAVEDLRTRRFRHVE